MTVAALSNLSDTPNSKLSLIGGKIRGRYLVKDRIGAGTFGTVYKVVDLESSRLTDGYICRAMKVINVADPDLPRIPPPDYVNRQLYRAVREIYYHQLVSSHPNIITLHEYFLVADREEMFLIMDYCDGGDLATYIDERRNPLAGDDRRMREIILQICGAVDFIHSKGVFHKDLKPQNILISRDGRRIFLCDFGLSTDTQSNTGGGTKPYMSPGNESRPSFRARLLIQITEVSDKQGFYCPLRADAWTLGIIILNMFRLSPWEGATLHSRRFVKFMRGGDQLLRARPISPEADDLIRDILRFHPELRLSVPEISARVLQLRSFFDNPGIESTEEELQGLRHTYRPMLVRPDPIARRRKDLEYLRDLEGPTLTFNDMTGRLLHPRPLPQIHVSRSPENPPPRTYRPHCTPIPNIPPPVPICVPEEPSRRSNSRQWHFGNLKLSGGWYYP